MGEGVENYAKAVYLLKSNNKTNDLLTNFYWKKTLKLRLSFLKLILFTHYLYSPSMENIATASLIGSSQRKRLLCRGDCNL